MFTIAIAAYLLIGAAWAVIIAASERGYGGYTTAERCVTSGASMLLWPMIVLYDVWIMIGGRSGSRGLERPDRRGSA